MDEILTLVLTSVITFLTYEAMRALFDSKCAPFILLLIGKTYQ